MNDQNQIKILDRFCLIANANGRNKVKYFNKFYEVLTIESIYYIQRRIKVT